MEVIVFLLFYLIEVFTTATAVHAVWSVQIHKQEECLLVQSDKREVLLTVNQSPNTFDSSH